MRELSDDELRFVVKSLSISYDSLSAKLERVKGRLRDEAMSEFAICDRTLTLHRTEQTERLTKGARAS